MTATPPPTLSPYPGSTTPPISSPRGGLAIASLVVGIAAFVLGLVPFAGVVIGATGMVLSLIAVFGPARRGFSIAGLALSAIASATNVIVLIVALILSPGATSLAKRAISHLHSLPAVSGQHITTPCYSFDGPRNFINNQPDSDGTDCYTNLELWGEMAEDGTVRNTGVGTILGQVSVEPVRESTRREWAAEADLDAVVEAMNKDWLPKLGTITSLTEATSLDGERANLTRAKSPVATTKTKAVVIGFAPNAHDTSRGDVRLFVVTFVTPYDNGEQLITSVVESWKWK
jgi:hypothetical protein